MRMMRSRRSSVWDSSDYKKTWMPLVDCKWRDSSILMEEYGYGGRDYSPR